MFASARRLPSHKTFLTATHRALFQPRQTLHPPSPLLCRPHSRPHAKQAALTLEPLTFTLAFVLSAAAAFAYDKYTQPSQLSADSRAALPPAPAQPPPLSAQEAQAYYLVMATTAVPGRPGNLTAEQETKLKEMWSQCLDIFGVANNSKTPSPTKTNGSTSDSSSAQKPKKRGLFGRGKTEDAGDASGNDKHGQVKEYQDAIANQSPEQLREAFWGMTKLDHPDALLLRFLRARKYDVQAAMVMLISAVTWRVNTMHVDDKIMPYGEGGALKDANEGKKDGADFMAQVRMGKSFLHGTDKEGRPLCYVRVKLHRGGEQSESSLEHFTVYLIETTRLMLRPPIDTATIVFDMTDFSLANMDYTPVKFMIKCFEANYPESLGSVLIYKAPWVFQGIWKIIKGWLDPVVANKVHFASNKTDLEAWVSRDKIPKDMGGDEDWTYQYVEPREGENAKMSDVEGRKAVEDERKALVESFQGETVDWVSGDGKGEGRMKTAQLLAENYWKLDPFVRARSLYDRLGVMKEGGKLDFYPSQAHVNGNGVA